MTEYVLYHPKSNKLIVSKYLVEYAISLGYIMIGEL